ncbi:MAG TPA: NeuD/PglB/VioB family sugar acetyltransferase [Euzebya sp.]|nr:NeuD/PglB/VioB family sugar acetyltransferase [Euzebya sp.]
MGLWIAGAGGFGRETLDALLAAGLTAVGFIDDLAQADSVRGLPVLRRADVPDQDDFVVGIAAPAIRRKLAQQLTAQGLSPRTVIHPRAIVGPETTVGIGCVILGGAHVSSSVTLGDHVHINYNATVGHDAVLGQCVTVLPGANVGGTTHLEDGVLIGSNAVVLQGLRIGAAAVVGAGAVVTSDVAPGVTVAGVPARPVP